MSDTDVVDAEVIETTELAVQGGSQVTLFRTDDPAEVLARATKVATTLAPVIRERGWARKIGKKEHVEVQGWQTLGSMVGVVGVVTKTLRITDDKGKAGWEAHCEARLISSGMVVGRSETQCSRSEDKWDESDDYAIKSMAQTRAVSRALQSPLRWIVELAGFAGTPAEEMNSNMGSDDGPKHICPACDHETVVQIKSSNSKAPKWKCEDPGCTGGSGGRSWASWDDDPPASNVQKNRVLELGQKHGGHNVIAEANILRNSETWNNPGEFKFLEQVAEAPTEFIDALVAVYATDEKKDDGW